MLSERLRAWHPPTWLGPMALMLVSLAAVAVVLWGVFNPVEIEVVSFDAGPAERFAIGEVTAYPEQEFYVVGLEDGRVRALDGRIEASGCSVDWRSTDTRGIGHNPLDRPGVFEDPCSGAVWSMVGNAISGTDEPMRTPHIQWRQPDDGGALHLYVELVNPP